MTKLSLTIVVILLSLGSALSQTPRSLENTLLRGLAVIDRWSNYGATPDYEKLEPANEAFKKELLRSARIDATLSYPFTKLKEKMYVVTSRDGKLRIYSWDRQTGGTMHDFDSVYQYRGKSGKVYSWSSSGEEDSGGVFYHDIFQVDSRQGAIYLPVSTFIGSSSLAGQTISAVKIEDEKLDTNAKVIRTASGLSNSISFGYDFFTVVDRPERPIRLFKFDPIGRAFMFPIVVEDEKTPQGRVTNKLIRYRFDGTYFVKVS
jgi:hypothetical protein